MLSSGFPFQSPFDSGGRLYGGCGSAPITPIDPPASTSRMPCAAASPVMPPPTIRYLYPAIAASLCQIEDQDLRPLAAGELQPRLQADGRAVPLRQVGSVQRHRPARHVDPRVAPGLELELALLARRQEPHPEA